MGAKIVIGKIFQEILYSNGERRGISFGFEAQPGERVRPSFNASSIKDLSENLARYDCGLSSFCAYGEPSIETAGGYVRLRSSIGAQVPQALEELAISISRARKPARDSDSGDSHDP